MKDLDSEIKQALNKKAENISPSDDLLICIKNRLNEEREIKNMKKIKLTPKVVIAVVFTLALATAAIGAGKIAVTESHSYTNDTIKHFPTHQEVKDILGYDVKFTEKLGNYDFESASPASSEDKDENGNVIHSYKDISFFYTTGKGTLTLGAGPAYGDADVGHYDEAMDYNGIKLYYDSCIYKAVPPEYEKTAEDAKLEAEGELQIGYGASELSEEKTQSLIWTDGDIKYCLLDMDAEIDKAEFADMAKQIIDAE